MNGSAAKAWSRALELTVPISVNPNRTFPVVVEELAERFGQAPALLSERERFTYQALAERSSQYARWAMAQGITKGDVVGLLMLNRPEYMAIWLGVTAVGGIVALLNTNLPRPALAHCIDIVAPKCLIVDGEMVDRLTGDSQAAETMTVDIWIHGSGYARDGRRLDNEVGRYSSQPLTRDERRTVTIDDCALYIYTSGTTGLPKAAKVSHARLMQWSHWFAGMSDTRPSDRMYNCLPMYHSVGGVLATGAALVGGGSVVIRDHFSARRFWDDVVGWDCTIFQYIGELCRYLLHADPHPLETAHRLRMCCGNGLRPDVWESFQTRFRIPQIFEFYATTEGNVSLFNIEGKPGAIGRTPRYLAHRSPIALVKFDFEQGAPVRNSQGFCIRCLADETGEAIGALLKDPLNVGGRFEGYTSDDASQTKVLRNVFETGDAWFRTGDLMRRDDQGYFYFVDRIGDTFRWKGENVATSEVSDVMCRFPGVKQASVYGVAIPGTDGRAGMATIVADRELDMAALRSHLIDRLPPYARPLFLRIRDDMEMTATFKDTKTLAVEQGYDPRSSADAIYFDHKEFGAFVPVDAALFEAINAGLVRV